MAPSSNCIRYPTTSYQSHPSHHNIPGDSQKPPTLESLDFHSGPSAVTTALQAKGVCREHSSTIPVQSPPTTDQTMACRPHMIRCPFRTPPHIPPPPPKLAPSTGAFLPFPKSKLLLLLGCYLHLPLHSQMGARLIPSFLEISNSPPQMGLAL